MLTHAATTTPNFTTHSHGNGWLITLAVVALLIATVGYLTRCWLFPFTTCHHPNPHRAWRCRHCHGTGHRVRTGRRLINHLRNTRHH